MIDFHTHILPEIDDGSTSPEMSVELLKKLCAQGVKKVLLTPHFYAYSSSAEDFCQLKERAEEILLEALGKETVDVELYSGCEVLFFEELWRVENLKDFCIKGTEYILVEMPFSSWTDSMVRSVEKLYGKGVVPIIAHFERYIKYKGNLEKIYELAETGALMQVNCKSLLGWKTRGKIIKFIKSGMVSALGTDCHNLDTRKPDYDEALKVLKKKLSENEYKSFFGKQKNLLKNAIKIN